ALRAGDIVEPTMDVPSMPRNEHWLRELTDKVHPSVTAAERRELEGVLREYGDCFSQHEYDLGRTSVVKQAIDTGIRGRLSKCYVAIPWCTYRKSTVRWRPCWPKM